MKDAYMIAYDISDDKWRTKTANKLVYYGFDRVQFSVFMGTVSDKNLAHFLQWFQKNVLILAPSTSVSLIVLPLSIGQLDVMQLFGASEKLDLDMLTGRKHTLII